MRDSVFDDEELLSELPVKASRIELPKPDITRLYTETEREWYRLQAMADLLLKLQKGLKTISQWEKRHLAGESVVVSTTDLMDLTGNARITVRKQFGKFRSHGKSHRSKTFGWKDVRQFAISRFTRSVFHEYLSALE